MNRKKIANVFRSSTQQWVWAAADDAMVFGADFVSAHAATRAAEAAGYEVETEPAELEFA